MLYILTFKAFDRQGQVGGTFLLLYSPKSALLINIHKINNASIGFAIHFLCVAKIKINAIIAFYSRRSQINVVLPSWSQK